ncbi:uncharacterized protein LOC143459586 [Clavelina lepadiformis]|uniref:uncharacterized protein LOC143459586 n=1 Tax=Clavelina lepadiformis TaxID=159417 RepID=UPI0040414580
MYDFYVLSSSCECELDNCSFAPPFGNIISNSDFLIPFTSMENHTVTIKAIPTSRTAFSGINFKTNTSQIIYFHISVRISSRLVVRNSYLDDRWDAEERQLDGFKYPFSVGREFKARD